MNLFISPICMDISTTVLPMVLKTLTNLSYCLSKGQEHIKSHHPMFQSETALLSSRLAWDMFPLSRQIQIACDTAKNSMARISGIEIPRFEDTETTIEQLQARIQKTIDFLNTIKPASLDGKADTEVTYPIGPDAKKTESVQKYVYHFVLPNFFFHVTTTYSLLRTNGVNIGKMDYLAGDSK